MQALGTGMVVPIGMNLTLTVSTPERLGTTMGIVSAMTTLGPSSGPIVAGAILRLGDRHLLFALFAVLVAAAWVAALVCVGDEAEITRPRLDAASTALISLALVGVLHGISTIFTGPVPVAVVPLLIALARPGRLRPAPGPHRRAADRPAAPAHQELRPRPGRHRPHAHDRLLDDHRPADVPAERAGPLAPRSGRHAAAGLHPVVRPVPGRRRALRSVRSARLSPDRPRGRRGLFTGALSRAGRERRPLARHGLLRPGHRRHRLHDGSGADLRAGRPGAPDAPARHDDRLDLLPDRRLHRLLAAPGRPLGHPGEPPRGGRPDERRHRVRLPHRGPGRRRRRRHRPGALVRPGRRRALAAHRAPGPGRAPTRP
ncbi:transporter, major facilitator domain protein [Propionibacterium acidifaciens F0233]|uniref:Transporter, major facilitator domain protein n=1 Tax=Propionibacterium acidifaciens F0233 TaxID=553198 RepID=U2PXV9_9ACTN|nr:transporter, major facilitator domain protein [Propionibacterium acidifaciens F0233]